MTGLITKEEIGKYSSQILELFVREKINSIQGLEKRLGKSFEVQGGIVKLEERPSGSGPIPTGLAHTISYIVEGKGIPIEIRLNLTDNYVFMIVKSSSELEDYSKDFYDEIGNIIQSKKFRLSFDKVWEELNRLS